MDGAKLAERIGVSEARPWFVTNTSSGMGLLKFGSVVISFNNQISKDKAKTEKSKRISEIYKNLIRLSAGMLEKAND